MDRRKQLEQIEEAVIRALHEARLASGLSQATLAEKAEISRPTVGHTENRRTRPTLWLLLSMAEALQVDLPKILSEAICKTERKEPSLRKKGRPE